LRALIFSNASLLEVSKVKSLVEFGLRRTLILTFSLREKELPLPLGEGRVRAQSGFHL
jgi:hypothetical protein